MGEGLMYNGARVLVAGGSGVIGVPVVRELISLGADVTVASLQPESSVRANLGASLDSVRFVRTDLTFPDAADLVTKGQDYVFNLVGIKGSVGVGTSRAASLLVPTIRFQTNLLDSAFRAGVKRFLFTGSVCAYPQANLHEEDNMWNGMPVQNDRFVGLAKRLGEALAEAYELEHGWDAVRIVRPANVYGPFDDFNPLTAQVIPSLISKALHGASPLKVWGDGRGVRDFVFSQDVAHWMIRVLQDAPSNTPLNVGSGRGTTIRDLAETVVRVVNPGLKLEFDLAAPSGDPIRLLSIERITHLLGYGNLTTLEDGIAKTLQWYHQTSEIQRHASNSYENVEKYTKELQGQ